MPFGQVGVANRRAVTQGGVDGKAEEIAGAADVATRGDDLLEDAVLPQSLGSDAGMETKGAEFRNSEGSTR